MRLKLLPFILILTALVIFGASCGQSPPPPGQPSVSAGGPALIAFDMVEAGRAGWALSRTGVWRTTDWGQNWEDVSPAMDRGANIGAWHFRDAMSGWLVLDPPPWSPGRQLSKSAIVLRTSDGGRTWVRTEIAAREQAPYPKAITFIDAEHGWLVLSYGAAAGSEAVEVFRTADGGTTWNSVAAAWPWQAGDSPTDVAREHALPFGGNKSGIAFRDRNVGWITGNDPSASPFFYATRDGGVTWQRQPLPVPEGLSAQGGAATPRPPVFFGVNDGVMPVTISENTVLYMTSDGGATWMPTRPVTGTLWSIIDTGSAFASDGSVLYRTHDGGQSWAKVKVGKGLTDMLAAGYRIQQIEFVTDRVGWALLVTPGQTSSRLLKTEDGGLTWR